jgi:hypothetical protein
VRKKGLHIKKRAKDKLIHKKMILSKGSYYTTEYLPNIATL